MNYESRYMVRLLNHNPELMELFMGLPKTPGDFGESVRRQLFQSAVITNPVLSKQYAELADLGKETHTVRETPITHTIGLAISMYGWKAFLESLVLYAKNKQHALAGMGLINATGPWKKIADVVGALPKTPQL